MAELKKILIIEDEKNLAKAIKTFLEQHYYQVITTDEGHHGVELIMQEKPNLVLTDLLLPRIHGFEICKKVKSDPQLSHIPVIVMTAVNKDAIYKLEAKKIGVNDFVEKPLVFEEWLEKVEKILGPAKPSTAKLEEKQSFNKQIETLQKEYAQQLPLKIMEMEMLWESIQSGQNSSETLQQLRQKVHRLTGSGATFGFKDLSETARNLEILLDAILVEGVNTIKAKSEKINTLLDNLRHHPYVSTELEILRQMKNKE